MNILLTGSGGREHTLAWKIAQSKKLGKLYIAPGNAGTASVGENVNIKVDDFEVLGKFALEHKLDMVVVGPEVPLVKGIHDYFLDKRELSHIAIIGPQKRGAMLEGSKKFANEFMLRHNIPTAKFISVAKNNIEEGLKYIENTSPPFVLKADGLAAGKGVIILDDVVKAKEELKLMLEGKFGERDKLVEEEYFISFSLPSFLSSWASWPKRGNIIRPARSKIEIETFDLPRLMLFISFHFFRWSVWMRKSYSNSLWSKYPEVSSKSHI